MGKAVDALDMIAVHDDCTKFLDKKFMNSLFSKISKDRGPLELLVEFMEYMFGKNALLDEIIKLCLGFYLIIVY